jgi:RNA recognition motif-containing protein
MSAIRVRGLPFSFNERDVYKIFEYYRPMKGSVKLGYRNFRKSGEAMLAFSCEKDALSSLNEDNINIRGRYL